MKKFVLFLFFLFIATVSQAKLDFSDFATKGFEGKGKLEFHSPEDVIMTNDGQFIIADQRNNRLQVLDSKGDFVRFIPENKSGNSITAFLVNGGYFNASGNILSPLHTLSHLILQGRQ